MHLRFGTYSTTYQKSNLCWLYQEAALQLRTILHCIMAFISQQRLCYQQLFLPSMSFSSLSYLFLSFQDLIVLLSLLHLWVLIFFLSCSFSCILCHERCYMRLFLFNFLDQHLLLCCRFDSVMPLDEKSVGHCSQFCGKPKVSVEILFYYYYVSLIVMIYRSLQVLRIHPLDIIHPTIHPLDVKLFHRTSKTFPAQWCQAAPYFNDNPSNC